MAKVKDAPKMITAMMKISSDKSKVRPYESYEYGEEKMVILIKLDDIQNSAG